MVKFHGRSVLTGLDQTDNHQVLQDRDGGRRNVCGRTKCIGME